MDRVYESGASATPPSAPATPSSGHPGNGNKTTGTMPTTPGAYWFYQIMEELMAVINAAAITPNHLSLTQLKQALDALYLSRTNAGLIKQPFSGLMRQLTPAGGAQVREYADQIAATTGNIEIGFAFNCAVGADGTWAGRDIADICWLEKWSDVGGVKEFWIAPTGAAGTVPSWTKVFSIDLVNGIVSVPTMAAGTNTQAAASTAFVTAALAAKAPLASPAFTGTPTVPTAATGTNTTQAASTAFVQQAIGTGAVAMFARNTAPPGWLKANGAAVSRTTYAGLFAVLGTVFGAGDGTTTFNLPDLRGEFLRGWDDARGVDTGRVFGSAQKGTLNVFDPNLTSPGVGAPLNGDDTASNATALDRVGLDQVSTADYPSLFMAGIGGAQMALGSNSWTCGATRPRNIALLACIKY
jgi:microcystin-dependent protein